MGPDAIHPRVLREMADIIARPLSIIFEKSWRTGDVPEDWRKANVTPIYKKGLREPYLNPWESYGTNPPGGHHKSNEAHDWEKPTWIH